MIVFSVGDGRNTRIQLDVHGVQNAHSRGQLPNGNANNPTRVFHEPYCRYEVREEAGGTWVPQDKQTFVPEIKIDETLKIRLNQVAALNPKLSDGSLLEYEGTVPGELVEVALIDEAPFEILSENDFSVSFNLSPANSVLQPVFQVKAGINPSPQASLRETIYNWAINATIQLPGESDKIYIVIDPLVTITSDTD